MSAVTRLTLRVLGCHPHILELLDVFHPHGQRREAVLVFPEVYCSMKELLRKGRRNVAISCRTLECLLQQCLKGLLHCHQQCVIHRDLSPTNLLIDLHPCTHAGCVGLSLKLADFGRARIINAAVAKRRRLWGKVLVDVKDRQLMIGQNAKMTPRLGTSYYAAPECLCAPWQGRFMYGPAIDIWSVGAIFFWAMTHEELMASSQSEASMAAALVCRLGEACLLSHHLGPCLLLTSSCLVLPHLASCHLLSPRPFPHSLMRLASSPLILDSFHHPSLWPPPSPFPQLPVSLCYSAHHSFLPPSLDIALTPCCV